MAKLSISQQRDYQLQVKFSFLKRSSFSLSLLKHRCLIIVWLYSPSRSGSHKKSTDRGFDGFGTPLGACCSSTSACHPYASVATEWLPQMKVLMGSQIPDGYNIRRHIFRPSAHRGWVKQKKKKKTLGRRHRLLTPWRSQKSNHLEG